MKDYGGFGEEPFYDFDGDGKLDFIEEGLMHADQAFQMEELDHDLRSSGAHKRKKKNSFWHDALNLDKVINFPMFFLLALLSVNIAEIYGDTGNIFYFILAIIILLCALIGCFINKPQKK